MTQHSRISSSFQLGFGAKCKSSLWPNPCCKEGKSGYSSGKQDMTNQPIHQWNQKAKTTIRSTT